MRECKQPSNFFFYPQLQTHLSPWNSSAKHPKYQRNRLAKGIYCDDFYKVLSTAKAFWLFLTDSKLDFKFPIFMFSYSLILADLYTIEKLSMFL